MASDEIVWKLRYQNLNSRLCSAETAYRIFLARSKRDRDELIPLTLIDSLNSDVEQLSKKLMMKVERLRIVINALKWQKLLLHAEGISYEDCEKWSEDVKDALHLFKMEGNLIMTDLRQQQNLLDRQVSAFHQYYNEWDKKASSKQNSFSKLNPSFQHAQSQDLPLEVLEFQEFMYITKKHQQEWSDAEHNKFLKLWKCKKLLQDLMKATEIELPSKFPGEILTHIQWYKHYLDKRERKIKALKEWKEQKQKEQLDKLNKIEQEMKEKDAKWRVKHLNYLQQRNNKVTNIFSWKIDKENAVQKAKREERKKARQKFLQQRKSQQKKAQRLRMIINSYHEKKRKLDQEAENHAGSACGKSYLEAVMRPRKVTKDLAKYWKRDKMIVYKRKRKIDEKFKRSVPPTITANLEKGTRDPSRIFNLTKSSKAKITLKPNFKKDANEMISTSERELPHRKIPSWLNCYNISKSFPLVMSSTL